MSNSVELDPGALERLKDWGGDELVGKMAALFLENAPQRVGQIRDGVAAGDLELVERGAHSLKSTAANLGATQLSELARILEEQAAAGEREGLDDRFSELEEVHELTRGAVRALLEGPAPAS